jgi:hypothetical protein
MLLKGKLASAFAKKKINASNLDSLKNNEKYKAV